MTRRYKNPYEKLKEPLSKKLRQGALNQTQFRNGKVTINYVYGPNNGPALVLIPAQMATWETYADILLPLSKKFQVYALDARGHGKSSWTPGDYSWKSIGGDMKAFLESVVRRPAIISGNSSGGLIALWCAANLPKYTKAIVLEDAPVFSAEMPRFKKRDKFVYRGLEHAVEVLGDLKNRDLANYFRGLELPVSAKRSKRVPGWIINLLSKQIKKFQKNNPGKPVRLRKWYLPRSIGQLFMSLSTFDPDFARAFVDGRFYEGLNHAKALKKLKCPMLVLHANYKRYPKYGLVGAMDARDAARIKKIVPNCRYKKVRANHVIHRYRSKWFVRELQRFAAGLD